MAKIKKDYSFLNKVIIFDNKGKTADRYTIVFSDNSVVFANKNCSSPNHGIYMHGNDNIVFNGIDFSGSDGDATHTSDKEEIKTINVLNAHIGSYLTINAMKRLSEDLLASIESEVEINEIVERVEYDYKDYTFEDVNISFEQWLREQYFYDDKHINIIKQFTNYIN